MCVFPQSEGIIEFYEKLAFQRYLFCKILTSAAKVALSKPEYNPDRSGPDRIRTGSGSHDPHLHNPIYLTHICKGNGVDRAGLQHAAAMLPVKQTTHGMEGSNISKMQLPANPTA